MNKKIQLIKYVTSDLLSSIVVWTLFYFFRLIEINLVAPKNIPDFILNHRFLILLWIVPIFWIFIHFLSGYYNQVIRKSRLSELITTFLSSFVGCIILFFILLINDAVQTYTFYYVSFSVLFLTQFSLTYIGRFGITQSATKKIHNRVWNFNTLIIGNGERAKKITTDLNEMKLSLGNKIIGYIETEENNEKTKCENVLGKISDIDNIIEKYRIEEIIIALDKHDNQEIYHLLGILYKHNIDIKTIPNVEEIASGGLIMSTIYATPLISLSACKMPIWQQNTKRILDIIVSIFVLCFCAPVFLYIALRIRKSSPGPIFYSQERIGKHGIPFKMFKFRTMNVNSENGIPQLASKHDTRITKFGKKIRKYRLDELPQFFNVLKGDMSIVGYRPERLFFIEKIAQQAPQYFLLQKIKPGITSWGMVKYGYADSVEKMIERLNYDIIYIENMSLIIDMKILIYTFKIILSGRGI